MKKIVLREISDEELSSKNSPPPKQMREPVHVVYGGAHLFKSDTPQKLGKIAAKSLEIYAPNFVEFARAMWLKGADALPQFEAEIKKLEKRLKKNPEQVKSENFDAWFAWTIYRKTIEKLKTEPVEDFRIDFEDGYGIRSDEEESSHAISASNELAKAFLQNTMTPFSGFRIKSFAPETYKRAVSTLYLFLDNLIAKTNGAIPANFVVTLPKITDEKQVKDLRKRLKKFESENNLPKNSIKIEIMVETPQAIVSEKGKIALKKLIDAGAGRVTSAHFGAYDYTAGLGIAGIHQHLRHDACNFARQMMLVALSPLNVRLSDSVTTELPVPVHKGENLSENQQKENKFAVQKAWRTHFCNIMQSQINGFYQSWDLHPAQLAARYAAVYSFFFEAKDAQAERLKNFIEKATQALTTGNQFDDAASAQGLLNFFLRAVNSGAMSESDVFDATGLNAEELFSDSFTEIMTRREKKSAVKAEDDFRPK